MRHDHPLYVNVTHVTSAIARQQLCASFQIRSRGKFIKMVHKSLSEGAQAMGWLPRLGLGNNTDFANTVDLQRHNQLNTTLRCQFLKCPD